MSGNGLTILIAALVLGYAAYLAVRMIRRPEKSCCGCSGCPMAGKCHRAQTERTEHPTES